MGRKKRLPDGLNGRDSILRSQAGIALRNHGWGKKGKPEKFNIPVLLNWMGLDFNSAVDQRRVYNQVILYWRKLFTRWFKDMELEGKLPKDTNRHEIWRIVVDNFNQNDKYLFFSKRESTTKCYYIQPTLRQIESNDIDRIDKQLKSIVTILKEMDSTGNRKLSGRDIQPMLEDTEKVRKVYIEDGSQYEKKRLKITNGD